MLFVSRGSSSVSSPASSSSLSFLTVLEDFLLPLPLRLWVVVDGVVGEKVSVWFLVRGVGVFAVSKGVSDSSTLVSLGGAAKNNKLALSMCEKLTK